MARRRTHNRRAETPGPDQPHQIADVVGATLLAPYDPLADLLDPRDANDVDDDGRTGPATEYAADGTRARIGLDRDPVLRRQITKRDLRRMLREDAAAEQIDRLPEPGEEILLILSGKWHGFDLFGAVLRLAAPTTIAEAHVSTLAINKTHARRLEELLAARQIGRITLIVGEVFREHSPSEWAELVRVFGADPKTRTLGATRNHTKLMALRLTDGRTLAIHGSLNLRRCSCYEQASLSADPATYRFFRDFVADVARGSIG